MYKKNILFVFIVALSLLSAEPLFEVKNDLGVPIFTVSSTGIKIFGMSMEVNGDNIWISDTAGNQLFAVSSTGITVQNSLGQELMSAGFNGMTVSNALGQELMIASSDSVRFYLNSLFDESRGGFAIGLAGSRTTSNFLDLTPENYFIGHESGSSITTGLYNNFLGYQAGKSNTKGMYNTFIGYKSGFSNVGNPNPSIFHHGANNTFVGYQTGYNNISGDANTFIGTDAGFNNLEANNNAFLGSSAGYNNTGANNTFIGSNSGKSNSEGSGNSMLGYQAGMNNTTGEDNIYIGSQSGRALATGNENVMLGNETCSTGLTYGSDGTGSNNVAVGFQAGFSALYGDANVFIGNKAGYNETGSNKLYIDNSNTTSPLIYGDFSYNQVIINGNLSNNSHNRTFCVNGTAGGTSAWYNDSDGRLKENVFPIDHALRKVCDLEGITFDWKDKQNREPGKQIGFIAQDVQKVLPEVVANENDHYSMQYAPITALLVEAIKEQQKTINDSENKIKTLETRISDLENLINKLANN